MIMRTIVIGDIHGCYRELDLLVSGLIEEGKYVPEEDRMIFIGDYIDRGDHPRLTVKYIRDLQKRYGEKVIALMGNHEAMLLEYVKSGRQGWLYNGCSSTILSYEGHEEDFYDDVMWMAGLPLYYEDDDFVYVHAGIDKGRPMDRQKADTLLWAREEFYLDPRMYGKKVIFGHTPTMFLGNDCVPQWLNHESDLAIDTGCVYDGQLTAIVIEHGQMTEYCQISRKSHLCRRAQPA